jgi:hypothetical protein
MRPNLENWSVVLAGHWNRMIFSADWVATHLFGSEQIEIEISMSNPALPPRFTHGGVALIVTPPRLTLNPRRSDDESLRHAEKTAINILQQLPHTPLMGVGINYEFVEEAPEPSLISLFRIGDSGLLADQELVTGKTIIQRQLIHGEDILNLSLGFENGVVTFGFNYHKEASDPQTAMEFLRGRVLQFRASAQRVMAEVYRLPSA